MDVYTTEKLYIGRVIKNIDEKENEEIVVCNTDKHILVTNGVFINFPVSNGMVNSIETEFGIYLDLGIVLEFLKYKNIKFENTWDSTDKKYSVYYVSQTLINFNCESMFTVYECKLDSQSKERLVKWKVAYEKKMGEYEKIKILKNKRRNQ
jgi:hypothetical protein